MRSLPPCMLVVEEAEVESAEKRSEDTEQNTAESVDCLAGRQSTLPVHCALSKLVLLTPRRRASEADAANALVQTTATEPADAATHPDGN